MRETLLGILERNARMTNKELAAIVGADEAAVEAEIDALEEAHVIRGYNTLIDWAAAGEERADAFIEVKVNLNHGQSFDTVAEKIYQYPEVKSLFLISGNFDFGIFVAGKTMREVAMFVSEKLSTIDEITGTSTQFILKNYKDFGILMSEMTKDEREYIS